VLLTRLRWRRPARHTSPFAVATAAAGNSTAATARVTSAYRIRDMRLFGSCEPKISNDAFDALVEEVLTTEPYASAQRVFWVVDNGTIHRGQKATDRLQGTWPNPMLVHPPRHASWLNQIEIYFSILARKAPTPCHFTDLDDLAARILGFQAQFAKTATPF
jgi:hypothetical protein